MFPRIDSDWSLIVLGVKRSCDDIEALRKQSCYAFGLVINEIGNPLAHFKAVGLAAYPAPGQTFRRGQSR